MLRVLSNTLATRERERLESLEERGGDHFAAAIRSIRPVRSSVRPRGSFCTPSARSAIECVRASGSAPAVFAARHAIGGAFSRATQVRMQSVIGYAKNVNGRRAASAYHLGGSSGRLSGSSSNASTTATPAADQQNGSGNGALDGVTFPVLMTPSPLSSSSSSTSSLPSLGGLEGPGSSSSNSSEMKRVQSTQVISQASELNQEWQVNKHGSVVDKTNPFIGYFQTGHDSPSLPLPSGLPPRSTSGAGPARRNIAAATPYATLLNQPKKIAGWIGSQNTRLPSMFSSKRDQSAESASNFDQKQQNGSEDVKDTSLLDSLRAAASSFGGGAKQASDQDSSEQKLPLSQTELLPFRLATTSRFEQDFEVIESLGQGGQGAVFKARSRVDGCYYAIKKVTLSGGDSTELEQARREAVSMAAIPPHSNVVRYHTAWIEVEPIQGISSSTASVRGSDVPDDEDEVNSLETAAVDDEVSFSVESSSEYLNFEKSFGGFEFEDPSHSMMTFNDENEESTGSNEAKLTGVGKTKLTLYIQMELCGTTTTPAHYEKDETFDRFVDRLKQKPDDPPQQEHHSNLTQWLRSSIDERRTSRSAAKHIEGLKLYLGVAQGVAHMHSVGVIHRDLKPDNIFIHGEVAKVGDFGLSKSIFADSKAPQQHGVSSNTNEYGDHTTALGTFTYASPEQLGHRFNNSKAASRVKSAKYSIKSDIFALGVILLELCCPFSTMMERSQVLTAVRHGVVPQKALQRYPTEMALVLRMTAVDPAERPTAEEICEQIRSLLLTSNAISARSALDEFRDLQALESLVAEMNDKIQSFGIALA
ncbi:Pek protein kinase, partial [Globisporangium splendens]